jgi:hypothetical protein
MVNEHNNGNNPSKLPEGDPELLERVKMSVHDAQFYFWAEIIKHFPEITTGDIDPWDQMLFDRALEERVYQWYIDNHREED